MTWGEFEDLMDKIVAVSMALFIAALTIFVIFLMAFGAYQLVTA